MTILAAHWVVMNMGRRGRAVAKLVDHRVRLLVEHGALQQDQLAICG